MNWLREVQWSPYAVGIGIGILSWLTWLISKKPIGCSTSFARSAGMIEKLIRGKKVEDKPYYQEVRPTVDWQLMLVAGMVVGAGIERRLPATGLCAGHRNRAAGILEQLQGREADARPDRIDQAGDEQSDVRLGLSHQHLSILIKVSGNQIQLLITKSVFHFFPAKNIKLLHQVGQGKQRRTRIPPVSLPGQAVYFTSRPVRLFKNPYLVPASCQPNGSGQSAHAGSNYIYGAVHGDCMPL